MSKLKAFFYIFYKSLTSIRYYEDVVRTSLKFSLKYFLVLTSLVSLIISADILINVLPPTQKVATELTSHLNSIYPSDLIITVQGGVLSINQPAPYAIPFPDIPDLKNEPGFPTYVNLVVFDQNGTLDDLEKYQTPIVINQNNILVKENNKIEVYPVKEFPNGQFTKQNADQIISIVQSIINFLPALMTIVVLGASLVGFVLFRLIYLLPVAFLLMLFGRIKGLNMEYKRYYQIAIHTMTFPLMIELIIFFTGTVVNLPLWFFTVNMLFGIAIVASMDPNLLVE